MFMKRLSVKRTRCKGGKYRYLIGEGEMILKGSPEQIREMLEAKGMSWLDIGEDTVNRNKLNRIRDSLRKL
jgi:hypothetical protein